MEIDHPFQFLLITKTHLLELLIKIEQQLQEKAGLRVERVASGSNIVGIHLPENRADTFRQRLADAGIVVRKPANDSQLIWLMVNETINRRQPEDLARQFLAALR